jgi:undecaprenyl diphosphate synthase
MLAAAAASQCQFLPLLLLLQQSSSSPSRHGAFALLPHRQRVQHQSSRARTSLTSSDPCRLRFSHDGHAGTQSWPVQRCQADTTNGQHRSSRWARPATRLLQSRRARDNGEDSGDAQLERVPEHIGFICDGNSRWAQARHLPALAGHAAGADRLVEILQCLRHNYPGVQVCTFYAFSTENWNRPAREVSDIFRVMEATIRQFGPVLLHEGVEFRALGDYYDDRIPLSLQELIDDLQARTREGAARRIEQANLSSAEQRPQQPPVLCVAINYGGRNDIVQAARRLARKVSLGEIAASDITESLLSSELSTGGLPDPDLVIRTSGEARLSNFFLWDAAYAELRFCDEMWPDFDSEALRRSLQWYASRHRRFGSRRPKAAEASAATVTSGTPRGP